MPPMFIPGDIIFAPWRAEDGSEKHRPTVVLAWSPAYGLVALWTGTAKERLSGGTFAFSTQEREQAGFRGPCPARSEQDRAVSSSTTGGRYGAAGRSDSDARSRVPALQSRG